MEEWSPSTGNASGYTLGNALEKASRNALENVWDNTSRTASGNTSGNALEARQGTHQEITQHL